MTDTKAFLRGMHQRAYKLWDTKLIFFRSTMNRLREYCESSGGKQYCEDLEGLKNQLLPYRANVLNRYFYKYEECVRKLIELMHHQ